MTVDRPGWDEYFLDIARSISRRAECTRRQVGALIVQDNRLVDAGYNGAPPGAPSCLDGACPRASQSLDDVPPGSSYDTGPGSCISLHAEMNAVASAARRGSAVAGAVLYVTEEPCGGCWKLIRAVGFSRVVWPDDELRMG